MRMRQSHHKREGRSLRIAGRLLLVSVAVFLAACTNVPPGISAIDGASVVGSDKTVLDHVAGWVREQDCSSVRAEKGGHWCQDYYENDPVNQPLYCYRTLGSVSCYAEPSTHAADKLVGSQAVGRQPTW